jgi:hypothetical protein
MSSPELDAPALAVLAAAGIEAHRLAFARWLVGQGHLSESLGDDPLPGRADRLR